MNTSYVELRKHANKKRSINQYTDNIESEKNLPSTRHMFKNKSFYPTFFHGA